jgi:ribonuclease J
LNEIGKNITALRCGDEIMIIDCGMSFPEDGMLGIDVVIPEFDYLVENARFVKGMILTHGHEDHIGAVPYLLKKIKLPIYGTRLTLGLVDSKLQEHGIKGDLRKIEAGDKVKIGKFKIETIRATHSVADSIMVAIETPAGNVFHTGDFKIDYTPIDGDPMDFQKLAEIGKRGIDLMMCESTNAGKPGFSESEKKLAPILEGIFEDNTSRIIIATFASNVHRVQTIINTAVKCKRKIALSGRSMLRVMDLARELGYLNIPAGTLVDLNDISNFPDKKLVIITTGSQGEPMSALTRMANQEHRSVRIKKGDTVVLSSSPIPGNEKTISNVINNLLELGADVIYSDIADIHVSGHACAEEIKIMLSLIKPKNFMPVHGEYKHLHQNVLIAEDLGIGRKNIFVLKNGNILEMRKKGLKISDKTVSAEPVFVDGLGVGDIGTIVLKDRKLLSESGLILVVATIDGASGLVVSGPEIISRGFVHEQENEELIEELRGVASSKLAQYEQHESIDWNAIRTGVKDDLRRFIYRKTKRSPVILTIIMEA